MTGEQIKENPYYRKLYDVDTNKITSIEDVKALFCAIGLQVSDTNENFDKVKHLLIIPGKTNE
jgi:hypothetical protein